MTTLASPLRKKLQDAVEAARVEAEDGIRSALISLEIAAERPSRTLTATETDLRKRLRARARQLGDKRDPSGRHEVERLVTEAAYEHWHRMLFARFLAESHLLMHPDGVAVSLAECDELAADPSTSEGAKNGWELAGRYASKMLPQIFRVDSPCLSLDMPAERQRKLEKLVGDLPSEVFLASDALGWVYQFWQTRSKKAVNDSGVKIGARELPAVTQLFTEPYMVAFLLDNALGAWWAARRLTAHDLRNAESEDELRQKAALPGVPLSYLRFVRADDGLWAPAAGTFERWPNELSELKVLDPCCGSGHFLVAVLLMLVPMRMELEALDAKTAVDRVLKENLHGLELDPRCVELAAFALALTAWRYPGAGGFRPLPALNVACSGLSVSAAKDEWKALGLGKKNLGMALEWLHETFAQAPVLGSLIDPTRKEGIAKIVSWDELSLALDQALSKEATADAEAHEAAVTAQGLAKAAKLMAGKYSWVVTNVPYLKRGKHDSILLAFCEVHFPASQGDLATVFLERALEMCSPVGTVSVVMPQNWLFLTSYTRFRTRILTHTRWRCFARLGAGSFETISGEVVKAILLTADKGISSTETDLFHRTVSSGALAIEVSYAQGTTSKAVALASEPPSSFNQRTQLQNADARVSFGEITSMEVLSETADTATGICTYDTPRFLVLFWELTRLGSGWIPAQTTLGETSLWGGGHNALRWQDGQGDLAEMMHQKYLNGYSTGIWKVWARHIGSVGVLVSLMGDLPSSLFGGFAFDNNTGLIVPKHSRHRAAIWAFCSSPEYSDAVRVLDQSLKVTNATLAKVPFDLDHWTQVAEEKYPNGLPKPFSDDPTQWFFHGHPCGSVVWDETTKWTADGPLRTEASVLLVAVARLLGYRWPAETDPAMELSAESRAWVDRCAELKDLVDDDGITCIPSVRGERPAAERLLDLIAKAYGPAWSTATRDALLASVGATGKGLEWWLREKFFEVHSKTFGDRPFIWHIWDGLKTGGFGALVNYHKLDKKLLETLTYTYLSDWISVQQADVGRKVDGSEERLAAAKKLQDKLKLIIEGAPPYDIFVRWKPLHEQPIGWEPDLDDGVRLNIRPFMTAEVLRHNKKPKLNIHWKKDRGQDVPSAPWYDLGPKKGGNPGDRINDHHLTLEEKRQARATHTAKKGGS